MRSGFGELRWDEETSTRVYGALKITTIMKLIRTFLNKTIIQMHLKV
jgi:hypothetical protein